MLSRLLIVTLAALVAIYGLCMIVLYLRQDRLVFPAGTQKLGAPDAAIPGAYAITLVTKDGVTLDAWYKPPASGAPVLVYLHGNAGSLATRGRRLAMLAEGKTGLLGVEYRGYAGNPGKPSQTGLVRDAAAAMTFLHERGIAPRRIVLYGESLGTYVAVKTALDWPVAGVVLDSPYTSVADVAAKRYPYAPVRALIRNRFDTDRIVGGLRVPLLVIRTTQDRTVPPEESLALFEAAPEPKEVWTTARGTHSSVLENGGLGPVLRFVTRVTASPATSP
ncbi:alpha/beta hydrolase [Swaminathania salitolerans]|uniref:Alpha/beta hydrolase n=1 Tax=Swaminathania salitolerans TaxID=182838 RepID=A0A511BQ15_9PROT|nr:alpha/beta hydrolase [Swaminathania salitolerans]GBQ11343.1 phospholipase [Swaminathania salitolerans LMG 21291]GEL02436.1 alpha/beta hydrolase [Swaminathania salitolerans]